MAPRGVTDNPAASAPRLRGDGGEEVRSERTSTSPGSWLRAGTHVHACPPPHRLPVRGRRPLPGPLGEGPPLYCGGRVSAAHPLVRGPALPAVDLRVLEFNDHAIAMYRVRSQVARLVATRRKAAHPAEPASSRRHDTPRRATYVQKWRLALSALVNHCLCESLLQQKRIGLTSVHRIHENTSKSGSYPVTPTRQ